MATLPISSAATGATTAAGVDRGMSDMSSEDFFKLLVAELRQQDPLSPSKTSDMIGQVSQIRSIELSKQLTDTLAALSQQQHTSGASELLGKYVTATMTADDGSVQQVAGIVTGVRFDKDSSAVLELDTGQVVRSSDVTHITGPENAPLHRATAAKTTAAGTTATAETAATDKTGSTAKESTGGLLPWLSLNGSFNL